MTKVEQCFAKLTSVQHLVLFYRFAWKNVRNIFVIGNIWGERSKIQSDSLRPLSREDSPSVEFLGGSLPAEGYEQLWLKTLSRRLWKHFSCQEYLALALYFCCERSPGSIFGQSGKRGFSFKSSHKSWSTQLLSISKTSQKDQFQKYYHNATWLHHIFTLWCYDLLLKTWDVYESVENWLCT